MQFFKIFFFVCMGIFFSPPMAYAVKFTNQFTEFELPPNWQCHLENAEWVCQSVLDAHKKEAIIVLAAKLRGDQDSLDKYTEYLKAPKLYKSAQGKSVKSEPKSIRNINLNDHIWVDALHLESELPGYITRYLITVKQDIGVLITYSVQKAKYQEYYNVFENMIKTLKVFRKQGGLNAASSAGSIFNTTQSPVVGDPDAALSTQKLSIVTKKSGIDDSGWFLLCLLMGGIGFFLYRRFKK